MTLLAPADAGAQTGEPAAGVALDLARARARQISHLRYELTMSIPAAQAQPVSGTNVLRFRLADRTKPLVIDFDAEGAAEATVTANGVVVPTRAVNGHLVIPASRLRRGENTVRIDFRAGDAPLNRSGNLLYTWFVPANARRALPCFDQPDLKGRWTVSLEHPAPWQSVANGAERDRRTIGDRVRVRFHATRPLPTYVLAFVVGDMKVETATRAGRTMRMFHRENDVAKLARNRDVLFDLHAQSLASLERYTGIPYPFAKFDFVLIPAFQPGAMEHAGNVAYRAESLLLDESATQDALLARAHVIAHETAHMWFGNLVTMRWFDDVWTKEVFANFIADKVIEPQFPQVRHDLQFFLAHHGSAYAVDRSAGANPIRQPLDNLGDAGSLYGPIVYDKSPVVMRQLEALLGEKAFRDGVRSYLRRHAFGNATWDDLIAALAGRTKRDLRQWSRMWVDEPGRPVIRTELDVHEGRVRRLALQQRDPQGRNRLWPQQLRVTAGCGAQPRRIVAGLVGREVDLTGLLAGCVPDYVLAGGDGWGYGEFELDARSQDHLQTRIPEIGDPLTRSVAWSALWDALLGGRMAPGRWFEMATLNLRSERDAQLIGDWLGDLNVVWWRFLTPVQRAERAPALESLLRGRLDAAPEPGLKSTWFAGLRRVATTPQTVAWLRALWQREASLPGLPLVEADETALAFALALRDVDGEQALLDAQRDRITNPDRRARFEFVRGAVSADAGVRERWFRALRDPANRGREIWVVQGLSLLNGPQRAEASAALVPEALDMLLEVHRTGALFFDESWLAATLGGHSSPQVASAVTRFIDALPADYPPRLRAKVLQASDLLMRAARVGGP
ncbi:M1 family aminopeptidase [uncultured Piscinibacter sp.]|uniref:M1 family aminopeptidase n=1 Tax=uncultured Piscinibacter sp. TaxID=1131835 RepID=UPI0026100A7B|nr:M1 family aminopeptidase [uncultured Piscinibacter sp.]